MEIVPFELTYPGTWLQLPDRDEAFQITGLLHHGETCLIEAALSLGGFVSARRLRPAAADRRGAWEAAAAKRQALEAVVQRELGIRPHDFARHDEVALEVERRLLRESIAAGVAPRRYTHQLPFLYARGFLYAVDGLRSALVQLTELSIADRARQLVADLDATLPALSGVRDSTAHADERVRGQRRGKPIPLKPVHNRLVDAPGGAMIIGSLNGDSFGATMADGHYGEVPVTEDTFRVCVAILQRALDALPWHGPPRLVPTAA